MPRDLLETMAGGVVLAAAVAFLLYVNSGRDAISLDESYDLHAQFGRADGLAPGSEVRLAGVRIGAVRDVAIDYQSYRADVRMEIQGEARVPEDSAAQIRGEGLFGGSYVSVEPGASDEMLAAGDRFAITVGAVDLIDLLGRAIAGGE